MKRAILLKGAMILVLTGLLLSKVAYGDFPDALDVGNLQPGQQVTITFRVTIKSDIQAGIDRITNQAVVSGANFFDAFTDDPDTPNPGDQTETPLNNPAPVYDFGAATYETMEGNSDHTLIMVSLQRSVRTTISSQVDVILTKGPGIPAEEGVDFAAGPVTVNFKKGDTTRTVAIGVIGDIIDEYDELVSLSLGNFLVQGQPGGHAGIMQPAAILRIMDDDGPPELFIDDVTLFEGDIDPVNAEFMVRLSSMSSKSITVEYNSVDGTATALDDYIAVPSTILYFDPGVTAQMVLVTVNGDTSPEEDETFFINLSSPVNVVIADNQAVGIITDDDTSLPVPIAKPLSFLCLVLCLLGMIWLFRIKNQINFSNRSSER